MVQTLQAFFKCILLLTILFGGQAIGKMQCPSPSFTELATSFLMLNPRCLNEIGRHAQAQINASHMYLALGSHFSKNKINRSGFAEHFLQAAKDKREKAFEIIKHMQLHNNMEGSISNLIRMPMVSKHEWENGVHAFKDAYDIENHIGRSLEHVHKTCDNEKHKIDGLPVFQDVPDHHADIAKKIHTLNRLTRRHGALGDFMFDKTI